MSRSEWKREESTVSTGQGGAGHLYLFSPYPVPLTLASNRCVSLSRFLSLPNDSDMAGEGQGERESFDRLSVRPTRVTFKDSPSSARAKARANL